MMELPGGPSSPLQQSENAHAPAVLGASVETSSLRHKPLEETPHQMSMDAEASAAKCELRDTPESGSLQAPEQQEIMSQNDLTKVLSHKKMVWVTSTPKGLCHKFFGMGPDSVHYEIGDVLTMADGEFEYDPPSELHAQEESDFVTSLLWRDGRAFSIKFKAKGQ